MSGEGVNNFVFLTLRTTHKQRLMNEAAQKQVVFSFGKNNNFSKETDFHIFFFLLLIILNLQMPGYNSSSSQMEIGCHFLCFQIKPQFFFQSSWKRKVEKTFLEKHCHPAHSEMLNAEDICP